MILITLAVVYGVYLVAANILLHTTFMERKLDKAFAGSVVGVHVTHGAAWTFFPGHMWIRNASVRCYNYDVEWLLQVDNHVAWLNPFALAWRSVHVMSARGKGVRFRLRHRRDRDAPADPSAAWLPPIEGLPDPPVHPAGPPPPPTGPNDVVWSMVFSHMDMEDVREIWIEKYHWIDSGRSRGTFSLTPGRSISVAVQLEMRSGEILIGDEVALEGATGHLDFSIDPMKLDAAEPPRLIPHLAAGGQMLARITSTRLFAPLLGGGTLDAHVSLDGHIRAGVLSDGTTADLSIAKADVRAGEWNATALGEMSLCVKHPAGKSAELVASVNLDHVDARPAGPGASGPIAVRGARLNADLTSPWVDVKAPFDPGEGQMRLDAKEASFRLKDVTMRASLTSLLRFAPAPSPAGTARPAEAGVYHLNGSHIELRNASVTRAGREPSDSGWWARVSLPELEVRPAIPSVHVRVATRLRDADPVLTLIDRVVTFPVGMFKLMTKGEVEGHATIRARPGSLAVEDLDVTGGDTLRTKGWLHRDHAKNRGAFLIEIGKTALGLRLTPEKTGLVLKSPREWFAEASSHSPAHGH